MAIDFEDAFFKNYMGTMYPMEQEMAPDTQVASANTGVTTDVGGIAEIPRNKAQEALGYVGQLLTKAGVKLDDYGIDVPALGRITLKDLTVGESGRILEDMSYGFMPVTGGGLATKLNPEVLDLVGLPFAGAAAKVVARPIIKATEKIAKALPKDLPVGMGIKLLDEKLDPLGFYSAASKAADAISQPKGTGAQFLAQIEKTPGVKKEELLWTGLDEFLLGKKSVTKAEVQDYLNTNRVEIKEVTLGSGPNPYPYRTADEWQDAIDRADKAKDFDESERLTDAWEAFEGLGMDDQTKFAKYTLPGGDNYREVLLTLPSKNPEFDPKDIGFLSYLSNKTRTPAEDLEYKALAQKYDASLRGETTPEFKSQHFDQPNVLAHMRLNDRVDVDGKKVLFVEEVQSDWHQAGRKKGYQGGGLTSSERVEYDALQKEADALMQRKDLIIKNLPPEKMDRMRELSDKKAMETKGVPDAPFKTSWHELSLKRAIQLASEGGYDRIAFTTGKTQAARYDLSKQIDELIVTKNDNGTYTLNATMPGGQATRNIGEDIAEDKLESFIGKDLAQKVQKQDPSTTDVYGANDLQVGGEGMKGFYDTILPKYLDKYGKKWDAKVGVSEIPTDGTSASVHYMDITPKMKESVLTKGQPLFQAAPVIPAGVAASQQEENK